MWDTGSRRWSFELSEDMETSHESGTRGFDFERLSFESKRDACIRISFLESPVQPQKSVQRKWFLAFHPLALRGSYQEAPPQAAARSHGAVFFEA